MSTTHEAVDVYQMVTDRIIAQLERGTVPWRKPWTESGIPQNLVTKTYYWGINVWMLASQGYAQNYFLTLKQIKALGGTVRKGEKGHVVAFWKRTEQNEGEVPAKYVLRYYLVFNIEQVGNLPESHYAPPGMKIVYAKRLICEDIIERMPLCPEIRHDKQQARYDPENDYVNMPRQGSFGSIEDYYNVLFHELVHCTGHQSRLNRKEVTQAHAFGTDQYSIEALTAEIGACYLNSIAGIGERVFDNNVAYIAGWLKALRSDRRLIVHAGSRAQRATDFILRMQPNPNVADEMMPEEVEAP